MVKGLRKWDGVIRLIKPVQLLLFVSNIGSRSLFQYIYITLISRFKTTWILIDTR